MYSYDYMTMTDSAASAEMLGGLAAFSGILSVVSLVVCVFMIVAMWKLFSKAGKPGWAAIVPIYNSVVLFQIAGMNPWLILACLIPVVNIVIMVMAYVNVSKNFGHGVGYAIGLLLLPIIFIPMLAFGKSEYQG